MDVVGSEIGQKMRSAIKAKLTELGCYVDDELPDYVMVMVANKRTRAQMEDDLQLFLGDNTELFVNWLHQVLKKLQEVTVPPIKEPEKSKDKVKTKKVKEKKEKDKTKLKKIDPLKKIKKRDKAKEKLRKKEEKKAHKHKKKSKHHDIIRPNIPPLLMNMEKESEPSITDVFAGQILKNHGVIVDTPKEEKPDKKQVEDDVKRPILPIIDPATIVPPDVSEISKSVPQEIVPPVSTAAPREEKIQEINEIEAKIQGLKQKLAEQLDSMSDDEDFLNIRTEAEELMNDFAEDVFQEISSQAPPVVAAPATSNKSPSPPPSPKDLPLETSQPCTEDPLEIIEPPKAKEPEVLPQIELKLPKRPVRERLGAREEAKKVEEPASKEKDDAAKRDRKRTESPERFTPEREPDFWGKYKSSAKSRLGDPPEPTRGSPVKNKISFSGESDDSDTNSKKDKRPVRASVVLVRPRARVAPCSSLLMRAVADAHKSLLNIPPKVVTEQATVKRALVHPMRRDAAQHIVIQVPADRHHHDDRHKVDISREEYIPSPLSKKIPNTEYVPSRRPERTSSRRDDTLVIETINIHNTTVDKDKDTQFIVTMDGFNPNAFLAKKLKTEGLLDDDDIDIISKPKVLKAIQKPTKSVLKTAEADKSKVPDSADKKIEDKNRDQEKKQEQSAEKKVDRNKETENEIKDDRECSNKSVEQTKELPSKKRLSDTSDDSDTQVIIAQDESADKIEKRKSVEVPKEKPKVDESPPVKKRKASPIVFDVAKKEKEVVDRTRQRTESASSDNHVVVTTVTNSHKYDALPSLPVGDKKAVWCRSFPLCRYGASCAFLHPRCKFAASCTRRGCPYAHGGVAAAAIAAAPTVASHVVPAANYKSISSAVANVCKYYPSCVNPACHFYHPKPCRYGKACANKLECNFYHNDVPARWRFPA